MNAIDFKQLRRQERKQAQYRSSHLHRDDNTNNTSVDDTNNAETHRNLDSKKTSGEFPAMTAIDPFPSLLPQNTLTEEHRIHASLDSIYYVRQFLNDETCAEIWNWLRSIPEYECTGSDKNGSGGKVSSGKESERDESRRHNGRWTRLRHARRKVALFDGTLPNHPLPPILLRLSQTLTANGAFSSPHSTPNHVLINEYQPEEGIMAHTDGPAYESCTATISLGGDVIFKISPRRRSSSSNGDSEKMQCARPLEVVLHGSGSLVVFRNEAYLDHCHEIAENVLEETTGLNGVCGNDPSGGTAVKRGYRVSLTFRCKKHA
ncbi:hypothetical protein HJC23_007400 [Cyclotella cryptica]|uniref:Fe2OG dioxygenase domain-containing protein n=1 Tax=Cyclotella cryptica TaxID=29204 RepID=A0ABD3QIR8_9STRA|eukprot:CCRYP_005128-RA/>CCRYP_005128-RA protein AED:0.03 eAED:0.03 QI:94/1/1/1/1/1/2/399/318